MFEAGPLVCVTASMLTVAGIVIGCSTNHERQSAVLFLAPEIHLKVTLYFVSSRLHPLTLSLTFFHLKTLQRVYDYFYSDVGTL